MFDPVDGGYVLQKMDASKYLLLQEQKYLRRAEREITWVNWFFENSLTWLVCLMVLGHVISRNNHLWTKGTTDSLRKVTFNFFLPCFIFQSVWTAPINTKLIATVAVASVICHASISCFAWVLFSGIQSRQTRAWLDEITEKDLQTIFSLGIS
jgi:hypothetical protein